MARAKTLPIDPENPDAVDDFGDDLTEEEIRQAEVGSLISLQGEEFDRVHWSISRFRTRGEIAADPQGVQEEWVADRDGQLHGTDLAESLGGGTFHLLGFVPRADGRGTRIAYNRKIALAGPRRNLAAPPPEPSASAPAAAVTPTGPSRFERMMLRMMKTLIERERVPAAPAAAPMTLGDLVDAMGKMDAMRQRDLPTVNPDKAVIDTLVTVLKQGVELGQGREPASDGGTDWGKVIDRGLGLMDKLATARIQRAQAVRPPTPAQAEVVTPPATPPAADDVAAARITAAIDALARAIERGVPPADSADTLIGILTEAELDEIINAPAKLVIEELVSGAGGKYPVLATEQGKAYLAQVIAELGDEPEDSPTA